MTQTYYVKKGNTFNVTDNQNIDIHDHLPTGTYIVLLNPMTGYYLAQVEPMAIPKKIYGHTSTQVERIYNTFSERNKNTGVLLNGEKGSGKTLTLALLAHEFMKNGLPVIIINSAFHGDDFNKFISEISQACMIAFDEFDKTYDTDDQAKILTLLDGVFNGNKLFVITCNDAWRINGFMLNRPGRIYYNLSYKQLEEDAIRAYCHDVLNNKEHIEGVISIANTIDAFNFDMLKALIEEMNRYNETAKEAVVMLNIRPERSNNVNYNYIISSNGNTIDSGPLDYNTNPLNGRNFTIGFYEPNPKFTHDEDNFENEQIYITLNLSFKDIKKIDTLGYVFEKDNYIITIVKESNSSFSYDTI